MSSWNPLARGARRWAVGLAVAGLAALVLKTVTAAPPPEGKDRRTPAPKRTMEEWRKLFPFESLSDRLAYEVRQSAEASPLSAEAKKQLDSFEKRLTAPTPWGNLRAESLRLLHSNEVEKFVRREGFGYARVPSPGVQFLEMPEPPVLHFPALSDNELSPEGEVKVTLARTTAKAGDDKAPMPGLDLLGNFHLGSELNFLNPSSFGYVKDRDHVAGFKSHRFWAMPRLADRLPAPPPKEQWVVRRLELVSLLKHDKPAVYVSDRLPRMDDFQKPETRELTDFEAGALDRLRKGEDLAAEATTNRIHLLGSLRAAKQCLDCHHGERGDLLGCFSYDLQRVANVKQGGDVSPLPAP